MTEVIPPSSVRRSKLPPLFCKLHSHVVEQHLGLRRLAGHVERQDVGDFRRASENDRPSDLPPGGGLHDFEVAPIVSSR